jgi:hypothetical protein
MSAGFPPVGEREWTVISLRQEIVQTTLDQMFHQQIKKEEQNELEKYATV